MIAVLMGAVLAFSAGPATEKPGPAPAGEGPAPAAKSAAPAPRTESAKPGAPAPKRRSGRGELPTAKRPGIEDDDDGDVPIPRLPPEVYNPPMSWGDWILSMAVRLVLVWGPLAFVVLYVGYVGMLTLAPDFGYRLRRRLPWGQIDRRKLKAEMHDLALQVANRDLPHLRYKLGRLYQMFGRRRQAVEMLTPVVAADPTHVDAAYMLGRALIELGRPAEAVAPLERAAVTKETHDYGGLMLALARAHSGAGRHSEAEADARRALTQSPDLPEGLYVLGSVLAAAGKRDEALAAWRRCREVLATSVWSFRRRNKEWLRKARIRLWFG